MKTDVLKFKTALLAFTLLSSNPILPAILPTDKVAMVAPQDIELIKQTSENDFLEIMVFRIKNDAVEATLELLDFLTDKKVTQETFDSIIKRCEDRINLIINTIIVPLELKIISQPNSSFAPIFEKTHTLAKNMALVELQKLVGVLKAHKQDPKNAKKVTVLAGKLKPHFDRLSSPNTLTDFNQKLTEIYTLAEQAHATIIQKLNREQLITDIKKKVSIIQTKINGPELLALWSVICKKL